MYPATVIGYNFNVASSPWGSPITVTWPQPQVGDLIIIALITGGDTYLFDDFTVPDGWTRVSLYMMVRWATDTSTSVNIWRRDSTHTPTAAWISLVVRPSTTIRNAWSYAVGDTYVDSSGGLVSYAPFSNAVRTQKPSDAIYPLFGVQYVFSNPATSVVSDGGPTVIASLSTGGAANASIALGYENLAPQQNAYGGFVLNPARSWVYYAAIWFYENERYTSGPVSISPWSQVQAAAQSIPWTGATSITPQARVTAGTPRVAQFGVAASYVATTDGTDAGSTATCQPGGMRRALVRFPLYGEYPPLARVTSVELTGTVTAAGSGQWQVRPYAAFADPEQDSFATQYAGAVAEAPYVETNVFATPGPFQLDLGPQASADMAVLNTPEYGYVPLAITGSSGSSPATLTNLALIIRYDVPSLPPRPLHEVATVSLLTADVPPRPAELDLGEYAARFEVHWQRPGAFELLVPAGSHAATKLQEMGHVHLTIHGVPIATGFQETWSLRATRDTGTGGVLIRVGGQTLHRVLANRITGPFPPGFNFAEQTAFVAKGADAEVWTAGDPSPRGPAFGPASDSAESVLRKLLMAHTTQAPAARRTRWTDNLSFAPDARRGVNGVVVSSSLQPLLAMAEKVCTKADCGYAVVLDRRGRYRWFFLPGVDRTGERGHWFLSTALSRGVEEYEVSRDVSQLVTHVVVAASGQGATRNLALFRQPGGLEERYDRREVAIDAQSATTEAAAQLVGEAYLAQHGPRRSVVVTLANLLEAGWLTAWQIGDLLLVEDPATGVRHVSRVYGVEITLGTEQLVRALFDEPAMDPMVAATLDTDSTRDGDYVAITRVWTAATPPEPVDTWKETSPTALT